MNKHYRCLLLLMIFAIQLKANIIYVKPNASGNGESWEQAIGNLQKALEKADSGDQIWVAKGTYYPTQDNNRFISFTIKNGIKLYGSFQGKESTIDERIIKGNYSVLSGAIGSKQKTDNTFNVIYAANVTETTIIDGFIVTGGYAGDDEASNSRFSSGGGMYFKGNESKFSAKLIIKNCRFIENIARDGGAIYNNSTKEKRCDVWISECTFQNNKAFLGGGAIFNNGTDQGDFLLTISKNQFIKNIAGFGGAIFNNGTEGRCKVEISSSIFRHNEAMIQGGGIFNLSVHGLSETELIECQFEENKAPKGSTVANSNVQSKVQKREVKL